MMDLDNSIRMRNRGIIGLSAILAACTFTSRPLESYDAGSPSDAALDSSPLDARMDAMPDARYDAAADASPDATVNVDDYLHPYGCDDGAILGLSFDPPDYLAPKCGSGMLVDYGSMSVPGQSAEFGEARSVGGTGYLSTPSDPSFTLTDSLTAEAWILPTAYPAAGQAAYILAKNNGVAGSVAWYMYLGSDGRIAAGKSADCNGDQYLFSTTPLPLGAWSHVKFVYDGVSNVERIVINGAIDNEAVPATSGICPLGLAPVTIGAAGDGSSRMTGSIDEVRISDVAR